MFLCSFEIRDDVSFPIFIIGWTVAKQKFKDIDFVVSTKQKRAREGGGVWRRFHPPTSPMENKFSSYDE